MRFALRDETEKSPLIHYDMEVPAVARWRCRLPEDLGSLSLGGTSFDVQKTSLPMPRLLSVILVADMSLVCATGKIMYSSKVMLVTLFYACWRSPFETCLVH